MYKFRTMQHNLDDSHHRDFLKAFVNGRVGGDENGGALYKPFQASQITRVGRILRKTSLDELPQLINVLRGEMTLVGPRPNVPWEFEEYRGWHKERLEVLPGITGLAQVRGRSGITFDSIVKYDIEYIEKQSLAMDLKVLWWTAISVLFGTGAQ
jgi:lipopolysaccharide/colanic/teichoic acid biosynthesis glycosyltransferase